LKLLLTADPEIPVPPQYYGGIERIVDGLITEMRFRGHTVGLVANANSRSKVDYLCPWASDHATSRLSHIQNTFTLRRAVREFQPHIVHSFSRLGYLLPLLPSRLPKVMSYQRHTGGQQIKIANRLAGNSLKFTGCSEFIARMGQSWGSDWVAVPNFVDTDFYTFSPAVAKDAPLVFLGRLERIKGVHTAIAIARKSGRGLILAGNRVDHNEGEEYWKSEIEPHLQRERVSYVGPVNDEQKKKLLSEAAALIVPIEWDEPFGIVFAEALACGTPVIACARGALPEIVRHGVEGFLIKSVADGCEAVERLGSIKRADCRKRVEEHFSRKVVVGCYDALYNRLLKNTHL
jgi:glycosyltransferase involved in cell wall biosynthesis